MARAIDDNILLEKLQRMIDYCKNDNQVNGLTALFQVGDAIMDCPTITPPNEPLTLEELREMDEPTPVWWDWVSGWVLARQGMIVPWSGRCHEAEELRGNFYRRPPEGEEDT